MHFPTIQTRIDPTAWLHFCLHLGNMGPYIWWQNQLVNRAKTPHLNQNILISLLDWSERDCMRWHHLLQSTPVISRQLGAKIRERELSGSPVISCFRAKAQTPDLQDHSATFWHLHLLNPSSLLSDNGCTYISRNSADIDIPPATNHSKPYYILIIMHQKLSNYTLHQAAYDGILKPSKPRCGLTGNGNGIVTLRGFHRSCMSFFVKNSQITFQIVLISALPV